MHLQSLTANQLREALADSVCESIEGLAFAEVVIHSGSMPWTNHGHGSTINLGDIGHLEIAILPTALIQVAATLHGTATTELEHSILQDTLLEITNVIAGRFCASLTGEMGSFNLGLPEMTSTSAQPHPNAKYIQCDFDIDGLFALSCRYLPA
jgi:hypothetical protein